MTPTARKFLDFSGVTPYSHRMMMRHGMTEEGVLVSVDYWYRDGDTNRVESGTIWRRKDGNFEGMEGCDMSWSKLLPKEIQEGEFFRQDAKYSPG